MLRVCASALSALCAILVCVQPVAAQCDPWWSDPFSVGGTDGLVRAATVFDADGAGGNPGQLYIGGGFLNVAGADIPYVAHWTGSSWTPLSAFELTSTVFDMIEFDADGDGPNAPELYLTGNFQFAGNFRVNRIVRFTGSVYAALGTGLNAQGYSLCVWDDDGPEGPNLPALYVGGFFTHAGGTQTNYIAKWNGSTWSEVGTGMNSFVNTLAVYDADGDAGPNLPKLYAGGGFTVAGGLPANYVASYDGTAWARLQMGSFNGVDASVNDMVVHDDGSGEALYVGGTFTTASGVPAGHVARWNGSTWTGLGSGVDGTVFTLESFDHDGDSSDPAQLYAGGTFSQAGGSSASRVAYWDGAQWSPMGSGCDNDVQCMVNFDADGSGSGMPALIIAGNFLTAGGMSVERIASWNCPSGGSPPTIIDHPDAVTVCATKSATFTVKATGPGTLGYQWRLDTQIIPGANSDVLTINPVSVSDGGSYDCVVSNTGGSVTSNPATLTVLECGSADMNCDGVTDLFDIEPFALALSNPGGYAQAYPSCNPLNGDCNMDTVLDLFDIDPFVIVLSGGP